MPHADELGQWLSAARAGSPQALGAALEAYRNYLLLIAEAELDPQLRAKAGASDLVQETFLEAQRDFAGFDGTSDDELRAWLRRLLLNNLANFARRYHADKRRAAREVPLQPADSSATPGGRVPADTPSPSGQAAANEQTDAVQQALARLPDDYRQVLLWRYQEQCSFEEIAQRLGRTANAARKLWARALERLQREMDAPP
jgi:RNA polymerase sigma-70 factor (ECF subfamily)